jgi:seryl-tRNA synthetase
MPLDINLFRTDRGGDPEKVRESQRRRFASVELVDEIIAKDNEWRQMTGDIDNLKKEKNAIQKLVGNKKKAGEEVSNGISSGSDALVVRRDGEPDQSDW